MRRGVHAVSVRPPSGGVIELVAVSDPTRPYAGRLAEFLRTRGEGMFQLVLQSGNLDATRQTLAGRDLALEETDGGLDLAGSETFGARIRIEPAA